MIKAVIFDVDGTLVDSVDFHARAWQETFREFGKNFPFQQIRMQIGKGGDQLMPVFLSKAELDKYGEQISQRRGEIFKEKYLQQVKGFPHVRELFQRVLAEGKKIALASSAVGEELETYKRAANIADLVDAETSADDADRSKPHADIFLAALERLGKPATERTMVVGDTPYDIQAAAKAGLRTIALRCGGFPEDSLRGSVAIYDDPADLCARYADSPLANS
jgi:HAD superfamily hydrolase (TIGR01549 family)